MCVHHYHKFHKFPFFSLYNFVFLKYSYKIMPRMGIFLNGRLGPKLVLYRHTTHLVSSSKDHFLQLQILYRLLVLGSTPSHQFQSDTQPPFLRYKPFPISFEHPYLPVPIMLQPLKLVRQFLLRM